MRIIAGKFKGKILSEFKLSTTRPTSDLVREALFDKIGFDISDSIFLDLFAGTGAVGIEAISRGASKVFFVDNNKDAISLIKKNTSFINTDNFEILNLNYEAALQYFCKQNIKCNIIFLDPPYATNFAEDAISIIESQSLLNAGGLIVWEHDEFKIDYIKKNFEKYQTKKYGKKFLTYIQM